MEERQITFSLSIFLNRHNGEAALFPRGGKGNRAAQQLPSGFGTGCYFLSDCAICCMMVGSDRVVASPGSRPSATSLRRRRMILPDRVLGSSGTTRMFFGLAMGPISLPTWL